MIKMIKVTKVSNVQNIKFYLLLQSSIICYKVLMSQSTKWYKILNDTKNKMLQMTKCFKLIMIQSTKYCKVQNITKY